MMSLATRARFVLLNKRYSAALVRYAFWLTGNRTLADDLVQETWMRAWSAFADLRNENAAKAWLFTILKREFLRRAASTSKAITIDIDAVPEHELQSISEEIATLELRDAIHRLPNEYREPLMLQVTEGFKLEEIGTLLGIPANTVATRVFRARTMLRQILNPTQSNSLKQEA